MNGANWANEWKPSLGNENFLINDETIEYWIRYVSPVSLFPCLTFFFWNDSSVEAIIQVYHLGIVWQISWRPLFLYGYASADSATSGHFRHLLRFCIFTSIATDCNHLITSSCLIRVPWGLLPRDTVHNAVRVMQMHVFVPVKRSTESVNKFLRNFLICFLSKANLLQWYKDGELKKIWLNAFGSDICNDGIKWALQR